MAIYHLSASFVSRSTGRSAVQSAAYICGTVLEESRRELTADYRNRSSDIAFVITLAPEYAPHSVRDLKVWDNLESFEDHYAKLRYKTETTQEQYKNSAQVAQTFVMALPKELTPESWKELVSEFAKERFISRGLVVTLAIHNDEGNPHVHLQVSRRAVNEKGEWSWAKDRDITTKASLIETRKFWAEKTNLYLEKEGSLERVDHRSFIDLGLPFEPTRHEGWFAHKLERMGVASRILEENKEIKGRNKDRVAFGPEAILKELSLKQATFSALDLARTVQSRLADDTKLASIVYEKAIGEAIVVGSSLDGQARYSSPEYLAKENEALGWVQNFNHRTASIVIETDIKENVLDSRYANLNQEQKQAVAALCSDKSLNVLIGRAGTGKTTTLKAVVDLHKEANYKVIGLALSASAAENLKLEANCESETVAFYLDKWKRLEAVKEKYFSLHPSFEHSGLVRQLNNLMGYDLTKDHVVIIDEAGMVGTEQWHKLLHHIQKAGAKCIAVGDDHQFKPTDAGDFFRKVVDSAKEHQTLSTLNEVFRQKEPWMRESSLLLANLKTYEALANYENRGFVQKIAPDDKGIEFVAKSYVEKCLSNPEQTGALLAFTNSQCEALNSGVRSLLKEQGILQREDFTIRHKAFAVNDKIIFLENDRENTVSLYDVKTQKKISGFIKNGTRGTIVSVEELNPSTNSYQVTVSIDSNTYAKFNTQDYQELGHAYATTLYKMQGRTVGWTYILASKNMDAYATYVAFTRHRFEAKLFYDEKTFGDFKALQSSLARISNKDLAIDYTIQPKNQAAWENVQEYKLLGQDLSATIKEKNWEGYVALKSERINLGKIILKEWDEHQHYMRQAGITKESLAIACGEKMRSLSLAEIEAQNNVALYAEKALSARLLWQEIKQTHPGKNCYQHERYSEFTDLRIERNALATLMIDNKPLYKEFVQELGRTQGIGWKTLVSQAKQGMEIKTQDKDTIKQGPSQNIVNPYSDNLGFYAERFEKVEPQRIKDELQQNIGLLAHTLLGEPEHKNAREWRYGNKGSVSICIAGIKQGLYANFELGSYGGPLKMIQDRLNLPHKEAYKWAIEWLGHSRSQPIPLRDFNDFSKGKLVERQWIPIYPVPLDKQNPDIKIEKNLAYVLQRGRFEVERYAYKDAGNNLLGYTVRLQDNQGNKQVLPLTYCQDNKGNREWQWKGFGNDRPLYGLDRLAEYPNKPVLIVEGEKTANCAQSLFSDWVVVSWAGGTGSVLKTDWSPLIGKEVILWPDNDEPGHKAMEQIKSHLIALNQEEKLESYIRTVKLPSNTPSKWDLADPLPKDWSSEKLFDLLNIKEKVEKSLLSDAEVAQVLNKYGINKPKLLSSQFMDGARNFYNQMLHWQNVLNAVPSIERNQQLLEKALLTQILVSDAKQGFCFGSSHLEAKIRSEDLSLIAAGLMQEHLDKGYKAKIYLEQANRILQEQHGKKELLLKEYQLIYPNVSTENLKILVEQDYLSRNTINKSLDTLAQEKVLMAINQFRILEEQGAVSKNVQTIVQQQMPSYKKETDKTVHTMIEREFMNIALNERMTSKEILEKSTQNTKQIQAALEQRHQQIIQAKMQEIDLSKEKER